MRRKIISIDEELCTGCELCLPNCPEGAIRMIDGKARLISDLFCDGLGACLGHCPEGAISIEEREAEPYDERKVLANIVKQGAGVIEAHLAHLKEHNEEGYLRQALEYLREHDIPVDRPDPGEQSRAPGGMPMAAAGAVIGGLGAPAQERPNSAAERIGGCPGARTVSFGPEGAAAAKEEGTRASRLTHWPIQLHLIHPLAPHFAGSDLLLAADCVPFAAGDFHKDYLAGKTLAIACPKLDSGQEIYLEKLTALIEQAEIRSLEVMIMQVPCCSGLLHLAQRAVQGASRKIPIGYRVVGIRGEILQEGRVEGGAARRAAPPGAKIPAVAGIISMSESRS